MHWEKIWKQIEKLKNILLLNTANLIISLRSWKLDYFFYTDYDRHAQIATENS